MKENDYRNVTNLTRLRIVEDILRDCFFVDKKENEKMINILSMVIEVKETLLEKDISEE